MQLKTIALASCSILIVLASNTLTMESGNLTILEIEEDLALLSMPFVDQKDRSRNSETTTLKLFRLAESCESKEQYSKALDLFEKVIARNYSEQLTWQARQNRAQIFQLEDKLPEAIAEYTQFIEYSSPGINQALAYSYRLDLNEKMGNKDEAKLDREFLATLRN